MALFEENADVLRSMEERGVILGSARVVDFSHVFPDAGSAANFIEACRFAGFEAQDTTDEDIDHHDVTVSKEMVPSCESITATEEALCAIAARYNGRPDGWGFFSN